MHNIFKILLVSLLIFSQSFASLFASNHSIAGLTDDSKTFTLNFSINSNFDKKLNLRASNHQHLNNNAFAVDKISNNFNLDYNFQDRQFSQYMSMNHEEINLLPNQQEDFLNYSGYQNVEGFKDTRKQQEVRFAAFYGSIIALSIIAGTVTIVAIINAIDD
jgi:hypothetical protein